MRKGFLDNKPDIWDGRNRRRKKKPAEPIGTAAVMYMKVRCPKCGSKKCPCYDSRHLPIRYHKCAKCGLNFKSIEKS
jgi:DNA-directed RNA polymerase subunit RPC12/RpoP